MPSGSIIRAAQIESRPNSVRNRSTPAATNGASPSRRASPLDVGEAVLTAVGEPPVIGDDDRSRPRLLQSRHRTQPALDCGHDLHVKYGLEFLAAREQAGHVPESSSLHPRRPMRRPERRESPTTVPSTSVRRSDPLAASSAWIGSSSVAPILIASTGQEIGPDLDGELCHDVRLGRRHQADALGHALKRDLPIAMDEHRQIRRQVTD